MQPAIDHQAWTDNTPPGENGAAAVAAPRRARLTATPRVWLGARSPFGIALPEARPTAAQMYAPRGVFLNDELLVVADSGNHRVLIWHGVPTADGTPADVVLGQADFTSEGPNAGGRGPANGLHLPTGVGVYHGQLFVADAWHHRILVWREVPQKSDTPPDYALGQIDCDAVAENRGGTPDAASFYWPYGIKYVGGWFYVADTGNRRVLGWRGFPEPGQPADLVLGQSDATGRQENRGGTPNAHSFRWPHDVAGDPTRLYVADAGNHRVLGWTPPPARDGPADLVLGQPDFVQAGEFPYAPQGPAKLRFPYAVATEGDLLAVADTANNRVLCWHGLPAEGAFRPAEAVIGQPDFTSNGENRWKLVDYDTLCWPYGIALHDNKLAVADAGNNRVMLWDLRRDGPLT